MIRRAWWTAAVVVGLVPRLGADPAVTVTATASKAEVSLGEAFVVQVTAKGPAGTDWTFPAGLGDDKLELTSLPAAGAPAAPGSHRYRAQAFALGDLSLPPITVRYRLPDGNAGEAKTDPVPLRVLSVLPRDPKQQVLADIRGPVSIPIGRAFWVGFAGLMLLLGALTVWLLRRRRREAPVPAVPPLAPDAEAISALDRLAAEDLLGRNQGRAFYIALVEVIKRYLTRRLDAGILEMTSSEAAALLRDHPIGRDVLARSRELFGAADQVKFARGQALRKEGERHLAAAREIVRTLEERLRPAPGAPEAA